MTDSEPKTPMDELREILKLGSHFPLIRELKGGFEIEMSSPTSLSYTQLRDLARFFGTEAIDVNGDIERGGGCSTCAYEHALLKIQVYVPAKNIPIVQRNGLTTFA